MQHITPRSRFARCTAAGPAPSSVQYLHQPAREGSWQLHLLSCWVCRYTKGPLQAASLQQWLASDVLRLPRVQSVTPRGLARFLSRAPAHKVAVLALSRGEAEPSLALRQALKLHWGRVTVRRAVVTAQVGCIEGSCELCKGGCISSGELQQESSCRCAKMSAELGGSPLSRGEWQQRATCCEKVCCGIAAVVMRCDAVAACLLMY